jgi:hypothetical protein
MCDVRKRHYYCYAEGNAAQSTEEAMKMLFLATAACLVLPLSSSAQTQKPKGNFSDQYCVPYCANYCAKPGKDGQPHTAACPSKCLVMCRELGH